jgi:hypothetical protein
MTQNIARHLLIQIEMFRAGISHKELSKRLGEKSENQLARYVAGKTHLNEIEFRKLAGALEVEPDMLARSWARSCGTHVSCEGAVHSVCQCTFHQWRHGRKVNRVPPHTSPMTRIKMRYADRLPRETPALWMQAGQKRDRSTAMARRRFARAYEMLVEFVHENRSQKEIGARRGISGERARQLMFGAACKWSKSEGIDLFGEDSAPFKSDAVLVKNFYAGLNLFAQYLPRQESTTQT